MLTLIVEPSPGGHRFQAVAGVAALAGRTGDVALLTSVGARERDEFGVHLSGLDIEVSEQFPDTMSDGAEMASRIADFCRARRVDTVVVMDGDIALKTWWWTAARQFRRLSPRPRIVYFLTRYPARLDWSDFGHWPMRIAKAVLVVLAHFTRTIHRAVGFASRDNMAVGWVVKRARDPALCSAHARDRDRLRAELDLPAERRLVGIFGAINIRKNPRLVLESVISSGLTADLLIAGGVDAETRQWLDNLAPDDRARVIVADGFLPDDVLDRYIAAADVVVLVMNLEGPSGIQGKALAAGVPVVTGGSRTRERELVATRSGVAVDVTVEGIAEGLRQVLVEGAGSKMAEIPLPTQETFAATILGVPAPR